MAARIGIIAEYNPFHEGHAHQIAEAKKRYPDADVVVFMSGDFVQRGEPAIVSKYFRAEAAVQGGADIVLSPPVFASVSAAGDFAYYGVKGLLAAGCDAISFGCEDPEIADFRDDIKRLIGLEKSSEYNNVIRNGMKEGLSYPAARLEAVRSLGLFDEAFLEKIKKPNNLLAFEYIRTLCELDREDDVELIPIRREGMGYHEGFVDGAASERSESALKNPSAEAIRRYVHDLVKNIEAVMKMQKSAEDNKALDGERLSVEALSDEKLVEYGEKFNYAFPDNLSDMLYYRLSSMSLEELIQTRDCNEDIANRIKNCLPQFESFTEFIELVKTKDITYTRVSRIFINALLMIGEVPKDLPYMYVLACAKDKRYIISDISSKKRIPLLVTGKDVEAVTDSDRSEDTDVCMRTDRLSHEIYVKLAHKSGGDSLPELFRQYIFV